jgi:hypothetical protein
LFHLRCKFDVVVNIISVEQELVELLYPVWPYNEITFHVPLPMGDLPRHRLYGLFYEEFHTVVGYQMIERGTHGDAVDLVIGRAVLQKVSCSQ